MKKERIIVVGGGVIGLSSALECARRGYTVTVLEAGRCGEQASHAAAGMVAPFSEHTVIPDAFYELCVAGWRLFPEWIDTVSAIAGRPLDYQVSGSLYAVFHEADIQALQTRMTWQEEQAESLEIWDSSDLRRHEPSLSHEFVAALYCPGEGHIDAVDYVTALKQACIASGVIIEEQTGFVKLEKSEPTIHVRDSHGRMYEGERLIVCAGAWQGEWADALNLKIPVYPIRGQMCAYDFSSVSSDQMRESDSSAVNSDQMHATNSSVLSSDQMHTSDSSALSSNQMHASNSSVMNTNHMHASDLSAEKLGQLYAYSSPVEMPKRMIFTSQGYFVAKGGGRLLHGASEDIAGFESEVTESGINRLLRWGAKVIPALQDRQPVEAWAGLRPATDDGWPLLGTVKHMERVIVAAGHYRNGILLSGLTAKVVADLIDQKETSGLSAELLASFAPDRFTSHR